MTLDRNSGKNLEAWIIIASVFILGCIARFCFYDLVSLSSDEIASIYFSLHPSEIFASETHPPLYYLFLYPFSSGIGAYELRILTAGLSIILITYALVLSRERMSWKGTAILATFLFLSPADIFSARIVRQYGLFLELTMVLLFLGHSGKPRWPFLLVAFILSGIHPLGWIPFTAIMIVRCIGERKISRESMLECLVLVPLVVWYLAKLLLRGKAGFFTHFSGNPNKYAPFSIDFFNWLGGEHFPRINFFPLPLQSFWLTVGIVTAAFAFGLIFRKKLSRSFLLLVSCFTLSFGFAFIFSQFIADIWNGRYFIFLLAPVYLLLAEVLQEFRWSQLIVLPVLALNLIWLEPFHFYPSERELVNYYRDVKAKHPEMKLVFCGNVFQHWYYVGGKFESCDRDLDAVRVSGKEFVLVDLNGYGFQKILNIKPGPVVMDYRAYSFNHAIHGKFYPK